MKLTINVFLLKAGRTIQQALTDEVNIAPIRFSLEGVDCFFYHHANASQPKWLRLFSNVE